jgi:hypothetical protein
MGGAVAITNNGRPFPMVALWFHTFSVFYFKLLVRCLLAVCERWARSSTYRRLDGLGGARSPQPAATPLYFATSPIR